MIKHMMSWARTGRFAERARTSRPIAENRDRGDGCRAQVMKNAAQLTLLRNSLRAGTLLKTICFPSSFVTWSEQDLRTSAPDNDEPI